MDLRPPGWYDSPTVEFHEELWDGTTWTGKVRPIFFTIAGAPAPEDSAAPAPAEAPAAAQAMEPAVEPRRAPRSASRTGRNARNIIVALVIFAVLGAAAFTLTALAKVGTAPELPFIPNDLLRSLAPDPAQDHDGVVPGEPCPSAEDVGRTIDGAPAVCAPAGPDAFVWQAG